MVIKMNLGYGFHVKIPTEEDEKQLFDLLRKRKENYPMIARITPLSGCPAEYIITSLDGIFLRVNGFQEIPSFDLMPATLVDLECLNYGS